MTQAHTTRRLETTEDLADLSSYTIFKLADAMQVVNPRAWFKPDYPHRRAGTLTLDELGNFISWQDDKPQQ